MGVQESMRFPLRTRKTGPKKEGNRMGSLLWLITLLVAVITYLLVKYIIYGKHVEESEHQVL